MSLSFVYLLLSSDIDTSVIILGFEANNSSQHGTSHTITDLRNELLGHTVEEIKGLDESPADYLYPYL
jgi:hypothetical protein